MINPPLFLMFRVLAMYVVPSFYGIYPTEMKLNLKRSLVVVIVIENMDLRVADLYPGSSDVLALSVMSGTDDVLVFLICYKYNSS